MVQISKINKLQQKNKAKNLEIIKTVTLEICLVISFLLHVKIQKKPLEIIRTVTLEICSVISFLLHVQIG